MTLERLPGAGFTTALRINELGEMCGYSLSPTSTNMRAVIWKLGRIQDLGVLPGGFDSRANAINDRGEVAVEVRFGQGEYSRAAVWRQDQLVELPLPHYADYLRAAATGINNAGHIVGNAHYGETGEDMALLWKDDAVYDLNDLIRADDPSRPYVRFQLAQLINNRGQIVVQGTDSRKPGANLSFRLTPSGHL